MDSLIVHYSRYWPVHPSSSRKSCRLNLVMDSAEWLLQHHLLTLFVQYNIFFSRRLSHSFRRMKTRKRRGNSIVKFSPKIHWVDIRSLSWHILAIQIFGNSHLRFFVRWCYPCRRLKSYGIGSKPNSQLSIRIILFDKVTQNGRIRSYLLLVRFSGSHPKFFRELLGIWLSQNLRRTDNVKS